METTQEKESGTKAPTEGSVAEACPADPLLRALWGQWKTHVVYALGTHGACRFGVLRRAVTGVSPKVLTQRLRELEADGLVWREHEATIPPKVTYGLTETGQAVHKVLARFDPIARAWSADRLAPDPRGSA